MGKLICFNFKKIIIIIIFFSFNEIEELKELDGGGNWGFREAIVDILLVQSRFQYYFLFC